MFKQQYKDANDSIPVNEELLNSLIAKAESSVKVVRFKNIYKYSVAVAAALILAVSAIALPNLTGNQKSEGSANLAVTTKKDTAVPIKETADIKDEVQNAKAEVSIPVSDKADTAKIQSNAAYDYSAQYSADSTIAVASETYEQSEDIAVMRAIENEEALKDEALVDGSMDIYEYLNLFGIDLTKIALPSGVLRGDNFIAPPKDDDGNIIFSETVISYFGDNKVLTLTVSQNYDYVSDMISLTEGGIAQGEDGFITAYITNDNAAFIADCINFSVNEVEALASSLK